MSELKNHITSDMRLAMKARDKSTLKAIRMVLGAIKQREVDERIELNDTQILSVIQKMVKQRKDSISQFQDANRADLVEMEEAELVVIEGYMPKQLSKDEVSVVIDKIIADTGVNSVAGIGKLMNILKNTLAGRADMGVVSIMIKTKLS